MRKISVINAGRHKKIGVCVLKGESRVKNFNYVCIVFPMKMGKLELTEL